MTLAIINYSVFLNFEEFIKDFKFNMNNYGDRNFTDISGVLFYFTLIYITFLTPIFTVFAVAGYKKLYETDKNVFTLILLFPLFFILYLGSGSLVINRNVSILIPFLVPVYAIGFFSVFEYFSEKKSNFKYVSLATIIFPLAIFTINTGSEYTKDARLKAAEWLSVNIAEGELFGTNEFCSEQSPAEVAGFSVEPDPYFNKNYQYYLLNKNWKSALSTEYWRKGFIQQLNQKYIHYYNFNDRRMWNFTPPKKLEIGDEYNNYQLINIFEGRGTTMYLYRKKRTKNTSINDAL
jgi:hypothetical protein